VTATNLADRLWETEKMRVDRRKLRMDTIKRIGRYTVAFEVFPDVVAELKLIVAPEGEELPPEAELAEMEAQDIATAKAAAEAAGEGPQQIDEFVEEAEQAPADEPVVESAEIAGDDAPSA
ncbi:MAG: hypothetical protein QOD85_1350, partial [Gaiellaceae bacterium]|nr:hypothetical protein [Gaiellaceae bacterium]